MSLCIGVEAGIPWCEYTGSRAHAGFSQSCNDFTQDGTYYVHKNAIAYNLQPDMHFIPKRNICLRIMYKFLATPFIGYSIVFLFLLSYFGVGGGGGGCALKYAESLYGR